MTEAALDRLLPAKGTTAGYLLRLSRPRFWFYLAGPVVVGIAYGANTPSEILSPVTIALFAYFLVPANTFLYGINDIFDADIDAENPKKRGPEVRYKNDRLVPGVVTASALLGLAFIPLLPTIGAVAMIAFLFLSIGYSAPPFRFKTTPFLDSISNGLYVLPGVVAYVAVSGSVPPSAAILGGWLWTMGMHTFSAIPDIEPDRRAGIETTATVLGEARTYSYCGICWLAAAVAFATLHPFFAVVFGIYPVFVAIIALTDVDVGRAYWWFPALNTVAGVVLTMGGLWVILYG